MNTEIRDERTCLIEQISKRSEIMGATSQSRSQMSSAQVWVENSRILCTNRIYSTYEVGFTTKADSYTVETDFECERT